MNKNDKEIIKKLFRIATNQQKIINKLAQQTVPVQQYQGQPEALHTYVAPETLNSEQDVTDALIPIVQSAAKNLSLESGGFDVKNAKVYNGELTATIIFNKLSQPGMASDNYAKVKLSLQKWLIGKTLKTSDGRDSDIIKSCNLTGITK
jgi:hypothetical protein